MRVPNAQMDGPMTRVPALVLLAAASVFQLGCASVDFDYPKPESYGLAETDDTHLGQQLIPIVQDMPGDQSGFFPIGDGIEALAARVVMAQRAERSIDAQYYLLKNDLSGRVFLLALLRAADRGVRVRLLLDDMFTKGYDAGMAGLDAHPNIEIRIFNPFARRSARAMDGVTSFSRINRRMHNKSFTADNQITLIGGRNIADEYFGARLDAKFGDLDVIGIGPVVQDVTDMFDTYWNHTRAAPVPAFAKMPEDPEAELERVRAGLEESFREARSTIYGAAVRQVVEQYMDGDGSEFVWAPYSLAVDSPDKAYKEKAAEAQNIVSRLVESLASAETELLIVSPYFVPLDSGIKALSEAQARGVDVTVITNSLAANNQATVHGGYAPSRKPLLSAGVRIWEVRADAEVSGAELVARSGAKATLHTKAFIVDRREAFIGSFNFDPRSANINTELAVIIQSPELAEELASAVDKNISTHAWEVFLNEDGKLRWRGLEDGEEVIYKKEPQTTWGQRFAVGFMRVVVPKGQL